MSGARIEGEYLSENATFTTLQNATNVAFEKVEKRDPVVPDESV
jgi:hypothetical protein